jgi:uncharacterized protein (DUF488 family)
MTTTQSILSIGYEKRTPDELLEILRHHSITALIDVREAPISRKKGFSKSALATLLASAGIEYIHLRAAGNPYRKLKADIDECLQLYSKHLANHPEVVDLLSDTLPPGPVAVLCYERSHEMCHRSILLNALSAHSQAPKVIQVQ